MTPTRRRFLSVAGLLMAAGCGLEDYEAKMLAEQKRLERFDAENKDLGAPLEMPALPEGTQAVAMFLRPPRGISSTPRELPRYRPLWIYEGSTTGFTGMGVCWPTRGIDLRRDVKEMFPSYWQEEWKHTTTADVGRSPVTLGVITLAEDNKQLFSYLAVDADKRLAILYRVQGIQWNAGRPVDEPIKAVIRTSMNSLVLGDEASRYRVEYNKRFERR